MSEPQVLPPALPPVPPRQKFPSWKQALITLFGGFVMACATCFGFLVTVESSDNTAVGFGIGFGLSLLAIVLGFIFLIIRIVRAGSEASKRPTDGAGTRGAV